MTHWNGYQVGKKLGDAFLTIFKPVKKWNYLPKTVKFKFAISLLELVL